MNMYTIAEWERIIEAGKHTDWGMERAIKESLPLLESWIVKENLRPVADWMSDLQLTIPDAVRNFKGLCAWPWFLKKHLYRRANRYLKKRGAQKRGGHLEKVGFECLDEFEQGCTSAQTQCVLEDLEYLMKPLNLKQRIAVELRFYHNMNIRHIARICGCTYQNVSERIKASLTKMRLYEDKMLAREARAT